MFTRSIYFLIFISFVLLSLIPVAAQSDGVEEHLLFDFELDAPYAFDGRVDPQETRFVIIAENILVFDLQTGELVLEIEASTSFATRVVWDTEGTHFAIYQSLGSTDEAEIIESIVSIYDAATGAIVNESASAFTWEFELPTTTLLPDTLNTNGRESADITDDLTLTLANPVTLTGSNSLTLGNGDAGVQWFAEMNYVVHWSNMGEAQVWDIETGEQRLQAIHYAGDFFTCCSQPFAPHLTQEKYLITFTYGGLYPNANATVFVLDDGLSLRSNPALSGNLIERLPSGTEVELTGTPVEADGYVWWPILAPSGNTGWSVEAADGLDTLVPPNPILGTARVRVYEIPAS